MTYKLVKLDRWPHWAPTVQCQVTEIYDVYAYNADEHTYACELTPSCCLMFLGTDYAEVAGLTEEEREALDEETRQADTEPVSYMHVADLDRYVARHPERSHIVVMDFDLDARDDEDARWNAIFDQLLEGWATGALRY